MSNRILQNFNIRNQTLKPDFYSIDLYDLREVTFGLIGFKFYPNFTFCLYREC